MNLMKSRGILSYKLISLVSSGWVKRATTQTSRCRAKEDVSSEQRDDVLSAKCVFQQKFLLAHSSSRISDNTDEIWGTLNSLLRYLQMRVSITSLNIACNNPCGVHWYLYQLSFLRASYAFVHNIYSLSATRLRNEEGDDCSLRILLAHRILARDIM